MKKFKICCKCGNKVKWREDIVVYGCEKCKGIKKIKEDKNGSK